MGVHKCPMRQTVWSSEKLISYVLWGHYWLFRAFGPISVLSHHNIHHVQIRSLSESALAYTFFNSVKGLDRTTQALLDYIHLPRFPRG